LTLSTNIVRCHVCQGTGAVQCKGNDNNHINSFCISQPVRDEERCNCCDGKGWITQEQQRASSFCSLLHT